MLGDLYRDAAQVSPRVSAARALTRAAEARVPGAKRPPDPEVQLGFMNRRLPGLSPMEPLGMTQLQLMQMIPVAGKLRLSGQAASARAASQAELTKEVEWSVRNDVAMAFYELYQTDQTLGVQRQTLSLLESTREIAEAMYRAGDGRQADVLRAHVAIARMAQDTIRMTAMRAGMAARLNALLDRPAEASVASPRLPQFPDSVPSLESLVAEAVENRGMVRAGLFEVQAADRDAEIARREIWPDLTIGLQYGQSRLTMPATTDPQGLPMPPERRTERMASLMIGASLPIFARSRQLQMRNEMSAMRRMAEADLAGMRAETRGEVARVHADLLRARTLAALYRSTVLPQAVATVESSLSAYRVGRVDFMTLLDSRMATNTYREELIAIVASEGKAWAELEMLVGRELLDADRLTAARAAAGGAR
jgi:cobalt-zinc-cadmium efflux system outer membrane protein